LRLEDVSTRPRRLLAGVNQFTMTQAATQRTCENGSGTPAELACQLAKVRVGEEPEVLREARATRLAAQSTNGHANQWKKQDWLPKKRVFKLFSQDSLIFSGIREGFELGLEGIVPSAGPGHISVSATRSGGSLRLTNEEQSEGPLIDSIQAVGVVFGEVLGSS
jgi:hypothetical protein